MNGMKRLSLIATLVAAGAVLTVLTLPADEPVPAQPAATLDPSANPPPPTPGPFLDLETFIDSKKDQKTRRKEWFKEMHRAHPDVDVEAAKRLEGLRQLERRNRLAGGVAPPSEGKWVERGSDNQAGRMHVARLAYDGTLYAGSSKGGVWIGGEDGSNWEPIGDSLYGGVHWLEVLDIGAELPRVVAATDGGLIHTSDDHGDTWHAPTELEGLNGVRRLVMTSDDTQTLYLLASIGSFYGLWRSTDDAETWTEVRTLTTRGDLWVPRTGGADLYVAQDGVLYVSSDQGDTWETRGTFDEGSTRAELAGSEAGALYVVSGGGTVYRSADDGWTWSAGLNVGHDYWGALNASIVDDQLFMYGGVEQWVSRDGGQTSAKMNHWWLYYSVYGGDEDTLLHADTMGIDVRPEGDDEVWYINTDGGLYESRDNMNTVHNLSLSGLRVSQYYDVHTSWANDDHVLAGAQDQGWQLTTYATQDSDLAYEFYQLVSGDYGHITSGDGTHEVVYTTYPGFILINIGEDTPYTEGADFPSGASYVPWIPPVVADPDDNWAFYFPGDQLYRYTRGESDWVYEVYGDFSLSGGEYVSAMAFSPVDAERVYMATSAGKVFTSSDHGLTWTQSESRGPDDNWYYGQAIAPSWTDADVITLGGSGYGVPAVYRSTDAGLTFAPWGHGLPDTLVYSLIEAMDGTGCVFAGTTHSAYERCPEDEEWSEISDGQAPITTYWAVEAHPTQNTIRYATYGRGIWDYKLDTPDCYPVEDTDGDGWWCHEDCDETDASIHPGAEDVLDDGIDQDCDGQDATTIDTAPPEDTDPPEDTEPPDEEPAVQDDPPVIEAEPNCGCSASSRPAAWSLLGILGLVALRRRR